VKRSQLVAPLIATAIGAGIIGAAIDSSTTSTRTITRTVPAPTTAPLEAAPHSCVPNAGHGVMGVCTPARATASQLSPVAPTATGGCQVPDVSEFQPHINWREARSHICGVVIRVADGSHHDTVFLRYLREVRELHIWHAVYFFERPWSNCASEADYALSLIPGGLDSGPLIGDGEVPLPSGCMGAFSREVERKTGLPSPDYSSSGTYPGGARPNDPEWDAAYGSSPGCFLCRGHRVAWQHTDGEIGAFPHSIPGIGASDLSRDEGLTSIVRKRPVDKRALVARQRTLRRVLVVYGCRRREHNHEHRGPRCLKWEREGQQVKRELAA
jgi:hypothetical protein